MAVTAQPTAQRKRSDGCYKRRGTQLATWGVILLCACPFTGAHVEAGRQQIDTKEMDTSKDFISSASSATKSKIKGGLRKAWERSLGFRSRREPEPSMISTDESEWETKVLFTVGEDFDGYFPPGVLDGMGAYELNARTVRVIVNHEFYFYQGYTYDTTNLKDLKGSRVSYFDINKRTREVVRAGLAYDTVYDYQGNLPQEHSDIFAKGFPGFTRFCSGRLVQPKAFGTGRNRRGLEDMIYFAPEEDGGVWNLAGGNVWALDVENGGLWQVSAMGRGAWENVAPMDTGNDDTVAFLLADDTSPYDFDGDGSVDPVPVYLYIGTKIPDGNFLERNGLSDGQLYVLVADTGVTRPSEFNGAGNSLQGRWVAIDNTRDISKASFDGSSGYDPQGFPNQGNLVLQANALGSFGFSRPEDVHEDPSGVTVVLASTGADDYDILSSGDGSDTFGTLYTITTDFSSMTVTLGILYDGNEDTARRLRSPDNLAWIDSGRFCVQEDKSEDQSLTGEPLFGPGAVNPAEAGILCIDPSLAANEAGFMERIATVDRDVVLDESIANPTAAVDTDAGQAGEWEPSGILDVSSLFGWPEDVLIANVQAHGIKEQDEFNAESRITDDDLVEGGQLMLLTKRRIA